MTISPLSDEELSARGMAIAVHARHRPDQTALITTSGLRSWSELNARANQLARLFRARGLKTGDGVALLAHNAPEFVETWAACQRAGLRLTAVNWHQSPELVAYVTANCDARALVASARFPASALQASQEADQLRVRLCFAGEIDGFEDFNARIAEQDPADLTDGEPGSVMLYTSGTTGRPKGVYRATRPVVSQLTATVNQTAQWRPESDVALVTGPLYHAAPLNLNLVTPIQMGVACVLMDKWDAEETLRLIERHAVTHTHVVPTMMHRLLQLDQTARTRYDLSSMRWVLHGAAPCPSHVKREMIEWFGPVLYEYYSATEGGGVFITSPEWLERPGSVGRPVPGVEVRVLDPEGDICPPGTEGAVYMKAPATGRFEYYKDESKTSNAYRGDWYTLGDMGRFDEQGFLFLTGRTAELIISGGVNIYPVEIDEVIIRHPAVADAAVIGVPNEDWGEEIKAVVELKSGYSPDETTAASILAFARDALPGFQRPRTVDFVETLPRSAAGKVLRQLVREPYWADRTRRI